MQIDRKVASNAVRMSVGRETTLKEIDCVIEDLKKAIEALSQEEEI
jgi:cysteine sulfinate desulfinase/cysteine desulfurase-like protein